MTQAPVREKQPTIKEVREVLEVVAPLPYADQIVRLRALAIRNRELALTVQEALNHCQVQQAVYTSKGKLLAHTVLVYKITGTSNRDLPTKGQCFANGKYYNVRHVRDNLWIIC